MLDPFSLLEEETGPTEDLQESIQEIPRKTVWAFILAVLLAQAGLLAVSVGLMLVGFRGQWTVGGMLFSGGIFALIATVVVHRWHGAGI